MHGFGREFSLVSVQSLYLSMSWPFRCIFIISLRVSVREDAVDERDSRRTLFKLANMFTNFTNISRTSREHLANSSRTYAVLFETQNFYIFACTLISILAAVIKIHQKVKSRLSRGIEQCIWRRILFSAEDIKENHEKWVSNIDWIIVTHIVFTMYNNKLFLCVTFLAEHNSFL